MGWVVVALVLPDHPSPGSYRPATDAVTSDPLHSALATMTPGLHLGFLEVAGICGRPVDGDRDNRLSCYHAAGDFPVSISQGIN